MSSNTPFCVIGHPLGHSMSPFIHDRLFALSGRTASYGAQDIPPETLSDELPRLLEHAAGVNVTIPHKQAVIPLLDGLYGRAELYRSVNTIAVTPEGRFGYNTDEIVSSDVIGIRYGSLFDATQTMVTKLDDDTYQVQVVSWYDNENSYTSQMVRTIKYFAELA